MRLEKEKAITLRKKGFSYNYISKKLNIPKSTLSDWLSKLQWSQNIKKDLTKKAFLKALPQLEAMRQANSLKWEKWREEARLEAKNDFYELLLNPLFITGVMIYWGEGDKNIKNPVRVSDTDPRMLRIYVKFLKNICKVQKNKVKAHLILYPDLKEEECKLYWSSLIGINLLNFYKTQFIKGRHKTKKLHYGICSVEVNSRQLKEKILVWIKIFSDYL